MVLRDLRPFVVPAFALAVLATPSSAARKNGEPELVGPLTREKIETAVPHWVAAQVEVEPSAEAAARLASVGEGMVVEVYLGTWCEDSQRELARLWRHLDEAGPVPFRLTYLGLAREPEERPQVLVEEMEILYLPTFVVVRRGTEVGRIVESAPNAIEEDLADLLAGEASGWLSGRDDLPRGGSRGP